MSNSTSSLTLRPARRTDISALATLANNGYAQSVLHNRMAPNRSKYPRDYYNWRLNIIRSRFATPDLRTMVVVNSGDKILGQAAWAVEGPETSLYQRWTREAGGLMTWFEGTVIEAEKKWARYMTDRSVDYVFLDHFMAAYLGMEKNPRPSCFHCHMIVVDPDSRTAGVGRLLIDWAKDIAVQEDLPLFLESLVEATGFYERVGFKRLSRDVVLVIEGEEVARNPVFVWEPSGRDGKWLERDGERWKWKDDVLPKK